MPTSSSFEFDLPERPETPDVAGAYPRLTEEQIMLLSRYGMRKHVAERAVLFCEGDRDCDFFVVLDGTVAVVHEAESEPMLIAVHGPRRFLGDVSLLTNQTVYSTAVAQQDVEVLAVPVDRLKEAVSEAPDLGDLILRAFMLRRSLQAGVGVGLRIIGSRFSADSRRLRDFVSRNRIPHRWIDLEEDGEAEGILRRLDVRPEQTPVVIWKGRNVLRNPSNTELARVIGLPAVPARGAYEMAVVGAGPAGLAAAVYGASEGLSTVVLDAVATGGQAATSTQIENYLGFPAGISGAELADRAVVQARKFGASFAVPGEARSLGLVDGYNVVRLGDGEEITAHAVILAMGVRYRRLDVPGLDRLEPASVYYAATENEARLCRGDPVTIIGGGNSAGQAVVFLARQAAEVNLVIRHGDLYRDMSRYLAERVSRTPRVKIWANCEVCELIGSGKLAGVVVRDLRSGEERPLDATALFVLIGATPHTTWLRGQIPLDDKGFVRTGSRLGAAAGMYETGRPGVFAVGDVRSGSVKRVASAVGEGAIAVRQVHDFLATAGRR
jgi:thioredoxin reductase (NADPH)